LDEAYDLLVGSDIRSHRRGQSLTTQLIQKLKERIRQHRAANRFEAALKDCDRAHRLGGNQPDLAELKEDLLAELTRWNEQRNHQRRIQREAHERVVNGDLTLGHVLCQQLPDATQERKFLSAEIEMKQQAADKSIKRAEAALTRDDFEDAVAALCEAKAYAAHSQRVQQLTRQAAQCILQQARSDLREGQLVSAKLRLSMVDRIVDHDLQLTALTDILNRCQAAAECLRRHQLSTAREQLQIVSQLLNDSTWIQSTLDLIERAQVASEALRTSPLSLLSGGTTSWKVHRLPDGPHGGAERVPASSSHQLLVQVDGAGRLLATAKPSIRLGPHQAAVDFPLQITRALPTLLIERMDDDYFLSAAEEIMLNGQAAKSGLLSDGDQITIGARCGVKFRMPCAASQTALLQVTGTRLEPRDVRTVILMDDAFLIGPDAQSHIRVRQLKTRFAVVQREGRLYLQAVASERGSELSRHPLELGVAVDLGGTSLRIEAVDR
jgi:hypothetical protein